MVKVVDSKVSKDSEEVSSLDSSRDASSLSTSTTDTLTKEARAKLESDLVSKQVLLASLRLEELRDKKGSEAEVKKLEELIEIGIDKLVRSTPGRSEEEILSDKQVIKDNLGRIVLEQKEERIVEGVLRDLADKKLSREELDRELSKIPDLNKEEALKMVARFELEGVASQYRGALRVVANKRDGEDALRLDLSLSLEKEVPNESPRDKNHRERLSKVHEERVENLLTKYEGILSREGINAVCKVEGEESLVNLYLSKTKDVPWETRRLALESAGVFNSETNPENLFRENVYKRELAETTSRMLQLSYEIGYFDTPGNRGDFSSKTRCEAGREEREKLKTRLEHLVKDIPEGLPDRDKILEEINQFNLKLGETEVQGYVAFNKFKEGQDQEAKADYERRATEGGALFAASEIFSEAGSSLVHLKEWQELGTIGLYESTSGLVRGQGYQRGAEFVERQRKFYNEHSKAGSIFGSDAEFSNKTDWELGLEVSPWGGVSHFAGGTISPLLGLADVGRVELSRRQIVGKALFGDIQLVADLYYGTESDPVADLTYSQYRKLEQSDSLLKTAKYSYEVAEISAGLALGRPDSLGALGKRLLVSGGMGAASAASVQLMGDESFDLSKFFEDTLSNTAGSQLFSGAMQVGSSAWVRARAGSILTKLNKGEALIPDEMVFLEKTVKQAQAVTQGIDFLDGHSDLKEALVNFKNVGDLAKPNGLRKLFGAILQAGVAGTDTVDVGMLASGGKQLLTSLANARAKSGSTEVSVPTLDETSMQGIGVATQNEFEGLNLPKVDARTKDEILRTPEVREEGRVETESETKVKFVSVREEFEFKETGRVITTHDNVQVPTQYLVIEGREYEGYLRKNEKVFYLVNESEIPDLYASILETRAQIDENGSYDVNSFIDKETGLIFTAMPRPNETPAEIEDRVKNSTHENQHRTDLVAGRELDERRAYDRASRYASDPASATFDESRYQGAENLSLAASRRNEGFYSPNEQQRPTVESLEKEFDELLNNGSHLQAGPWIPYFQNLVRRSQISSDDRVAMMQLAHGRHIFVNHYEENESRIVEVQANAAKRILTTLYTTVDTELAKSHWEKVTLKRELEGIKIWQWNKWAENSMQLERVGKDIERLEALRTSVSNVIDPNKDFIEFGKGEIESYGRIARIGSEKTKSNGLVEKIMADNLGYNNIDDYWQAQLYAGYSILKEGQYNAVSQTVIDYAASGKDRIEVNQSNGFNIRNPSESGYRRQNFIIGKKDRYSLNVNLSKALIDQLDEFALRNGVDYKVPSTADDAAMRTDVVTLYAKVPLTKEAEIELAKIAREHARNDGLLDGEPVDENGLEVSANIKRGKDFTAYDVDILVANAQRIDPSLAAYIKNESLKSGRGILSPGTYHAFENIIREHRAKYVEGKVAKNVTPTFKPWLLEMKVGESKVIGRNDLQYFASPPPGEVSSQHVIITRNRDFGGQPSFTLQDRSYNGTTIKFPNGVVRKLSNGQRIILVPGSKVLLDKHELPLIERASGNVPSPFERQRNIAQLVKPSSESGVKDWKEGRARVAESRQLKNAKINYFPSREALETEFVRQESLSAEKKGEKFNESESIKRAQETYGFFSRVDNQIYVLTPETLQDGATGLDRSTRILQAMAVIHELNQKRLEDASPAENAQEELDQEIAVWKKCAVYLKSRGYEFQFTESGWKILENKSEVAANNRVIDLKAKGRKVTLTLAEENHIKEGVERLYAESGSDIDRIKMPSRALSQMRSGSESSLVVERSSSPEVETISDSELLSENLRKLENGRSLSDNEILDLLIDIDRDPLRYDAKAKGLLYEALIREGYDDIESLCSNISMDVLSEAREDYYTDLFKQFRTSSNNLTHVERMRLYERLEEFALDGILSLDKFNLLVESKNLIERIGLFNFDPTSFSPSEVADMLTKLEKSGESHLLKDREIVLGLIDESVRQILDNYSDGKVQYSHAELIEVVELAALRAGFGLNEHAREEIVSVDKLVDLLSKGQTISSDELAKVIRYSKKLKSNGELLQRIGPLHPQYLDIQKGVQENLVETRVLEPIIGQSVTSQSFNPISDRVLAGILVDRSDTVAEATYETGTRDKLLQGFYLSDDEILGLIDSVDGGKDVLTIQEMSVLYGMLRDRDLLFLATDDKTLSLNALEQANLKYCNSLLVRFNENLSALNLVEKARLLSQLEDLNLTVSDQQREILNASKNVLEMVGRFNFKPDLLTSRQATKMYIELKRSSELYLISDPTTLKAFVNTEVVDVLNRYSDREGADAHLWLHSIAELAMNEDFDLDNKLWNEVDQIMECSNILDRFVTGDKIDQVEMDKLVAYSRTLTSFNELLNLMGEVNPHYNEFKSVLENQSKEPVDVAQTQPLEVVDVPAKNYSWTSKDDLVKDQVYYSPLSGWFRFVRRIGSEKIEVNRINGDPRYGDFYSHTEERSTSIFIIQDNQFFAQKKHASDLIVDFLAERGITLDKLGLWFAIGELHSQIAGDPKVQTNLNAIAKYEAIFNSIGNGERLSDFIERVARQMNSGPIQDADLVLATKLVLAIRENTGVDFVKVGVARQGAGNAKGNWQSFSNGVDNPALFSALGSSASLRMDRIGSTIDDVVRRDLWDFGVNVLDSAEELGLSDHAPIILGAFYPSGGKKVTELRDGDRNTQLILQAKDSPNKVTVQELLELHKDKLDAVISELKSRNPGNKVIVVGVPGSGEGVSASQLMARELALRYNLTSDNNMIYRMSEIERGDRRLDSRTVSVKSQKKTASLTDRLRNIGLAYDIRSDKEKLLENVTILLVDDVYTSGATLEIIRERLQPADVQILAFGGTTRGK